MTAELPSRIRRFKSVSRGRCLLATCLFLAGAWSGGIAAQSIFPSPESVRGLQWRNIGPFRGGRVTAVAGYPDRPESYWMGAAGGGLWHTEDAGHSWQNASDPYFQRGSIGAIAIAPSDPNVIYVGTGEAPARGQASSEGDGLYKSTDAGHSWTHLGLRQSFRISRIRVHPNDPDLVYVAAQGTLWSPGGERGVFRSKDGGHSWENVLSGNPTTGATDLTLDPANPRILIASLWDHLRHPWHMRSGGPGSGLFKSTDGGDTWQRLERGLPSGELGKMGVSISAADSHRVYAIIEAGSGQGGLYRSDDSGDGWRRMSRQRLLFSRPWYFMRLYADPADSDTVYVLNMQMTKSIDGGEHFEVIPTPHGDNHDLWINPLHPDWMINSNDGGANISFNGGKTWSTQLNQPTGQFYRVITDNLFPYNVYACQQDNSSALEVPTRSDAAGISTSTPVGGGESGFVGLDPDDPRYVYAGANMNQITEYDRQTGQVRNVMLYPEQGLGRDARDLKYRFNWNAPILVSRDDPNTIFHASNIVHRSRNRGFSWENVSPDLTRNEEEKHGSGGGPITGEAAGGEYYNTILYLEESPLQAGLLWVGTDDGLVYLTRDEGQNWEEVTPPGIGESDVNAIDASSHRLGTAFLAVTGFRNGDLTPQILRTDDFGQTWKSLTKGIRRDDFVRVVRQDPVAPDLLFAGSNTGVYSSTDSGEEWQPLQLNLPAVPVTDITIHDRDVVISTEGRGFWILDDITPLRRPSENPAAPYLYPPAPALRVETAGTGGAGVGKNPPDGAFIYYALPEASPDPIRLEILDSAGDPIRSYTSAYRPPVEAPSAGAPLRLSNEAGLNRLVWDFRHEDILRVPGVFLAGVYFGTVSGYRAPPGTYQVRLSVGGDTFTQPLEVRPDPRIDTPPEAFRRQTETLAEIRELIRQVHQGVIDMRRIRSQIGNRIEATARLASGDEIRRLGNALAAHIEAWENQIVQPRHEAVMDVVNFPTMLNEQLLFLKGAVASADARPTRGALDRLEDLKREWQRLQQQRRRLLEEDLAAFNRIFESSRIPAVVVP